MSATFRSLRHFNYRVWFAGGLVSNVGTWMQRTAQDWIVLTELSGNNALALGVVMALQFGPQLVLFPLTGWAADRFPKRRVLMVTQGSMGLLGLGLGLLVLTGVAELWHVYIFAVLLGIAAAFDVPARQSFVTDLVPEHSVSNAVALNSASFNSARLIGPAVAGLLVAVIGAGWVFLLNSVSFVAVFVSLMFIRVSELRDTPRAPRGRGQLLEGVRYVWRRSDLMIVFGMVLIVGMFAFNFPIFTATMATEFRQGPEGFGVLSSMIAIGSVAGALLAARRERPRLRFLVAACALLGCGFLLAASAPVYLVFALALIPTGLFVQTFMATANGLVQLGTDPIMRGRVMALYMAIFMGGTPVGAPIMGAVVDHWGPRMALVIAAAAGLAACLLGVAWLVFARHLRLVVDRSRTARLRVEYDGRVRAENAASELASQEGTVTRSS